MGVPGRLLRRRPRRRARDARLEAAGLRPRRQWAPLHAPRRRRDHRGDATIRRRGGRATIRRRGLGMGRALHPPPRPPRHRERIDAPRSYGTTPPPSPHHSHCPLNNAPQLHSSPALPPSTRMHTSSSTSSHSRGRCRRDGMQFAIANRSRSRIGQRDSIRRASGMKGVRSCGRSTDAELFKNNSLQRVVLRL